MKWHKVLLRNTRKAMKNRETENKKRTANAQLETVVMNRWSHVGPFRTLIY